MESFESIPIIDIGELDKAKGVKIDTLVQNIRKTYGEIGFAYIVNHNIDPRLVEIFFKNHSSSIPCLMMRK